MVRYTNTGVAGRYQKRSTKRLDLNTVAEAADADLARVAAGMLGRSDQTYRPVSFDIASGTATELNFDKGIGMLIECDLEDRITVERLLPRHERLVFANYAICQIRHQIQVRKRGIYWTGTIGIDIEVASAWSVETLPFALWGVSTWGDGGVFGP